MKIKTGISKFSKPVRKFIYMYKAKLSYLVNAVCLTVILILLKSEGDKAFVYAAIVGALDLCVCAIIIFFLGSRDKKTNNELKPIIENVTLDFIHKLRSPIVITDWKGYILWFNNAMEEFISESDINKKSISAVTQNQLSVERFSDAENIIDITLKDKNFKVKSYRLNSYESTLYVFTFDDVTEFELMKASFEMKDPVVAYFMVDNLDEVTQKMQDKYRMASGAVSDLLQRVMAQYRGVIKEYDRDRYLCVFEAGALKNFIKAKFSGILDSAREIKVEELNMSVTISGGVSNINGSLAEKEAAATQALELALQRGGDQIGVRSGASTEFYGGKTKTVQKKTKVRSRIVANELTSLMKSSSNVIIMGHKFADNDSIGACVGVARLALSAGCRTSIVVNIHDKSLKSTFAKLRGIEEYKDIFQDETAALDSITSETLLVTVDVNNPIYFESQEVYKNVYKSAVIDHHRKTGDFPKEPDIVYIEPSASSASELIAEMLEQMLPPGELLKEEAELLLAGIILDTKQFSRNTGTKTFSAALYLRGEGGNPSDAVSMFKTNLDEFTKEAKFESNIFIYRNIIGISVCETEMQITDKVAGAKAADRILTIDGVTASFVLFRIGGTVHISARSLGNVNVQLILESMGGGGHFDVAGAQISNATIRETIAALKRTIDEYFDIV